MLSPFQVSHVVMLSRSSGLCSVSVRVEGRGPLKHAQSFALSSDELQI